MEKQILMLREHPELTERAAVWFSEKWEIPVEEYRKSIEKGIQHPEDIPQWYLMVEVVEGEPDGEGKILAGAGLIENDFHPRKDLKPNLCALYVEEEYRLQGIARAMLDFIRSDAVELGYDSMYLITEHENFYEKCGWHLYGFIRDDDGRMERMYYINALHKQG